MTRPSQQLFGSQPAHICNSIVSFFTLISSRSRESTAWQLYDRLQCARGLTFSIRSCYLLLLLLYFTRILLSSIDPFKTSLSQLGFLLYHYCFNILTIPTMKRACPATDNSLEKSHLSHFSLDWFLPSMICRHAWASKLTWENDACFQSRLPQILWNLS